MTAVRLSVLLAVVVVAGAGAGPSASPPAGRETRPCVFSYGPSFSRSSCAPFTKVGIRVLAAFPSRAFGTDQAPQDIAVLDDGSLIVQTDRYGLYRIANGHMQALWRPAARCGRQPLFSFAFVSSFDDEVLVTTRHDSTAAVRADGSLAFRLSSTFASVAQDSSGVVWLLEGTSENETLYAYFPKARTQVALESPTQVYSIFRSPNGHVYATRFTGLLELDARPAVRARMVHGPIRGLPIQAVGRDGSLWAATSVSVIHLHPDGTLHEMRLAEPPNVITHPLGLIGLTMTRDGAVWTTDGKVRIDNEDRIQVVTFPQPQYCCAVKIGPDSSLWMLVRDPQTGEAQGVVNFAAAGAPRSTTAWPFKPRAASASPTPFVPCPPPTPPPTPRPPLPPQRGPVDFVCAVNSNSNEVWGYWVDRGGKLVPVRGAPFGAEDSAPSVAIEPAGHHLYVGGSGNGISGYAIDARSGTLHLVHGSPFPASKYGPTVVVFDRSGRYAYAANLNDKNVTEYAIDEESGALRPLPWSPLALGRYPFRLVRNPVRDLAYVVTDEAVETFDLAGGKFTLHSTTPGLHGGGDYDLLVDRRGKYAYVSNDSGGTIEVYDVDPHSGTLAPVSVPAVKAGKEPRAMVMDPRGRFLYVTNIAKDLTILGYRINSNTGMLSPLPTSPFADGASANAMTVTPDGAFLYATNFGPMTISGFAIDPRTGSLWPVRGSPFKMGATAQGPAGIVSCHRVAEACRTTPQPPTTSHQRAEVVSSSMDSYRVCRKADSVPRAPRRLHPVQRCCDQ